MATTPVDSANLLLKLYELRREEKMRKGRDFWFTFNPTSAQEYMAAMAGPDSGYIRMVSSYWEMACSFVVNGAIDAGRNASSIPFLGPAAAATMVCACAFCAVMPSAATTMPVASPARR